MEETKFNFTKILMNPTIFHKIYFFLTIKDLIAIMRTNIELYKLANEHFKLLLEKLNLIDINPFLNSKK